MIPRFLRRPWLVVDPYPDRTDVVGRHRTREAADRRANVLSDMAGYEGVPLRVRHRRDMSPPPSEAEARRRELDRRALHDVLRDYVLPLATVAFAITVGLLLAHWLERS